MMTEQRLRGMEQQIVAPHPYLRCARTGGEMRKWTNVITVRDLMIGPQSSIDGTHWEPSLPLPMWTWGARFGAAWEVWQGRATAVRQTTSQDVLAQDESAD